MSKKLITACMALFALAAFVLPAVASASPVITHPTGTAMAVHPAGTTCTAEPKGCIVGTNIGTTKLKTDPSGETAPSTLTECTNVKVTGELTKNNGTEIEGNITTATFSGEGTEQSGMKECKGSSGILGNLTPTTNGGGVDGENVTNGTPWCLKASGTENKFTLRGGKCSEETRKITFILDSTKLFEPTKINECKYERSNAIEGTFTTDVTGDAILTVTAGKTEAEKAKTTFKGEAGNNIECPATGTLDMAFTLETDAVLTEPLYIS